MRISDDSSSSESASSSEMPGDDLDTLLGRIGTTGIDSLRAESERVHFAEGVLAALLALRERPALSSPRDQEPAAAGERAVVSSEDNPCDSVPSKFDDKFGSKAMVIGIALAVVFFVFSLLAHVKIVHDTNRDLRNEIRQLRAEALNKAFQDRRSGDLKDRAGKSWIRAIENELSGLNEKISSFPAPIALERNIDKSVSILQALEKKLSEEAKDTTIADIDVTQINLKLDEVSERLRGIETLVHKGQKSDLLSQILDMESKLMRKGSKVEGNIELILSTVSTMDRKLAGLENEVIQGKGEILDMESSSQEINKIQLAFMVGLFLHDEESMKAALAESIVELALLQEE